MLNFRLAHRTRSFERCTVAVGVIGRIKIWNELRRAIEVPWLVLRPAAPARGGNKKLRATGSPGAFFTLQAREQNALVQGQATRSEGGDRGAIGSVEADLVGLERLQCAAGVADPGDVLRDGVGAEYHGRAHARYRRANANIEADHGAINQRLESRTGTGDRDSIAGAGGEDAVLYGEIGCAAASRTVHEDRVGVGFELDAIDFHVGERSGGWLDEKAGVGGAGTVIGDVAFCHQHL